MVSSQISSGKFIPVIFPSVANYPALNQAKDRSAHPASAGFSIPKGDTNIAAQLIRRNR